MTVPLSCRAAWLLMVLGRYAYGDHVSDPQAFELRLRRVLRRT